ncbi:basic helix-loop-helix (bHLH) DNA-binding family protein [Euphorbia peplus]|nr:basic helix-loop-helix (bHLH) DNA-binding family protein [Euphorbia peplus]
MDTLFSLVMSTFDRHTYLRSLLHSFGCSYVCLWLHLPHPTDHLFFFDGYYYEDITQPGSSSGSLARRLFHEYRQEMFFPVNDRVPGMAFISNQPYRKLNQLDLQRMASIVVQRQFYQEAKIKTAVFLGCRSGEIEMGWSNGTQVINMESSIMKWFSDNITSRGQQSPLRELSQAVDPNRVSPTSSSLSLDSPESSSHMLFNIPSSSASHIQEAITFGQAASLQAIPSSSNQILQFVQATETTSSPLHPQQTMQSLQQVPTSATITTLLHHQAQAIEPLQPNIPSASTTTHQAFSFTRNMHLPVQEIENEAMTRAILAVLTSSSPPNLPHLPQTKLKASAFKKYLAPTSPGRLNLRRQTMLKRSITYYTNLNIARRENMLASRPTSTQLHHMISERKRREKINESFEALRKLLPPEAKKDKASVLTRTRDYLSSLRDQIEELNRRNRQLEAQLLIPVEDNSSERVDVRITHVNESTSQEQRIINLQVLLRGGECSVSDMVIRILEFLKLDHNVNLISMEASTFLEESRSSNRVVLRLGIEGNEWDESAFQEALKRVVNDLQ